MSNFVNQRELTTSAEIDGFALPFASTPTEVGQGSLVLGYAPNWRMIIENLGPGNITAIRTRRRSLRVSPAAPWVSVTTGLPIATAGTISLSASGDNAYDIDVELTVDADSVCNIYMSGA
jgi:hypothetical protein